jgi:hypothetical protein
MRHERAVGKSHGAAHLRHAFYYRRLIMTAQIGLRHDCAMGSRVMAQTLFHLFFPAAGADKIVRLWMSLVACCYRP